MSEELEQLRALYEAECEARQRAEHKLAQLENSSLDHSQQLQHIGQFLEEAVGVQIQELQVAKGTLESEKREAESANKAKTSFLANMSHEIRTPLTAIIGFSQSIKSGLISEEKLPQIIDIIIDNGKHLLNLINDILDLSKIEAEQLTVESIDVDLYKLLHELNNVCEPNAQNKQLSFVIEVDPQVPSSITSDPTRLRQILLNLCNNALKFTQQGGITIKVGYFEGLNLLEIDVIDTGVGIPQEKAEKLFTAFTQADESTTRKYGGTGLGLYISKQLAQMLGGDITLDTELGKGSTFSLSVDCGLAQFDDESYSQYQKRLEPDTDIPKIPQLSGRVLLAEDNKINQDLIAMHIKACGVELDIADDGQQAVELALQENYDLVLMDIQMPNMDGKEAFETLQALGFTKPVIALTANVISSDVEIYTQMGFTASLAKPIDLADFYATLAVYLKAAEQSEQSSRSVIKAQMDPFLLKLRKQYQAEISSYHQQIESALQAQNWQALYEVIHVIKGTAGSFGFDEVTDMAAKIQEQLRLEETSKATALIPQLKTLLSEAQNE